MDSARGDGASLAVVILAGGEGRRIGGGKPLRVLGNRTLLERAIERARGWSETIAISVRDPVQVGGTRLPILIDPPGMAGPLAGLAAARALECDRVLTIPCDMPFLPDDLPDRLAAVLPGHAASLASAGGRVQPVCGLWMSEALTGIEDYAASGQSSVVGFARTVGFATAELEISAVDNINTPDELVAAQTRFG
jgi:molybdopterin-guanine dinucleotide biosynthesis protein A